MSDQEIKLHEDEGGGSKVETGEADNGDVKEKSDTKRGENIADGKLEGEDMESLSSAYNKLESEESVVEKGMVVKLPTEETHYFDYAWPPFMQSPCDLEWMGLAEHQVTYPHLQIYQLKIGDSISPYLSMVESMPATKALVLVNTTDSLQLDQIHFTEDQTPPVPTVVIGKSNGEKILEFLKEHGRELKICIECSSFEDVGKSEEMEKNLEIVNVKEKDAGKNEKDIFSSSMGMKSISSEDSRLESAKNVVKKGMAVKLPTEETHYFDYAWPPFTQSPCDLEWMELAEHQVTYPHLQIYQLKIGDSLSPYLSMVESMPATNALVLVNTTNSLQLDQTYFTEGQTPSVPTVVIERSSGERILEFLREHGRELKICIDSSSFEGTGKSEEETEKNLEIVKVKEKDAGKNEKDIISIPMGMKSVSGEDSRLESGENIVEKGMKSVSGDDSRLESRENIVGKGHQTPPVPTVVIGKSNGEKILEFLKEHGRELKICLKWSSIGVLSETGKADVEGKRYLEVGSMKGKDLAKSEQDMITNPMGNGEAIISKGEEDPARSTDESVEGKEKETSVEDDVRSRRVTDDEEKEKEEKEWGEEDKDSMFPLQTLSNLNNLNYRRGDVTLSLPYAWIPFNGKPCEVGWTELSSSNKDYEHILICDLPHNEQLSNMLLEKTLAVILVCAGDIYELSKKTLSQCQNVCVPTIAVTLADGETLISQLQSSNIKMEVQIDRDSEEMQSDKTSDEYETGDEKDEEYLLALPTAKGLKIRKTGEKNIIQSYSYAWPPFNGTPRDVDWAEFTSTKQDYDHILICELPYEEPISTKLSEKTQAVIIVCDGNRYELNKKTISQCQKISVPTVAVTIVDGNSLMSFLKTSNFQWNISIENIPVEIVNETKANEQDETTREAEDKLSEKSKQKKLNATEKNVNASGIQQQPSEETIEVLNGIQVTLPTTQEQVYFPYAWLPISKEKKSFQDIPVALDKAPIPHVRVCGIEQYKPLNEVFAENRVMEDENVEMLLVINCSNTYHVPELPNEKWDVPVAVITAHSGAHLKHILQTHGREAKINVHLDSHELQRIAISRGEGPNPTPGTGTAKPVVLTQPRVITKRADKALDRAKDLLFDDKSTPILERSGLFQLVMSEFDFHEEGEIKAKHSKIILQELLKNCETTFKDDFPIYFIIIHRICFRKKRWYDTNLAEELKKKCISLYCHMSNSDIAKTLLKFVNRGNIKFLFTYGSSNNEDAFQFLQNATNRLLAESSSPSLHSTVLLIITYYFFNTQTKQHQINAWESYFVLRAQKFDWTSHNNNIKKMCSRLALLQKLQLPSNVFPTSDVMRCLLVPKRGVVCSFEEMRTNLPNLMTCFVPGNFLCVAKSVREEHDRIWSKKKPTVYLRKNLIEEGLELLDKIMSVAQKRSDEKAIWKEECIHWLDLLLGLVDINNLTCVELLTLFLERKYSVCQANLTYLQNNIVSILSQNLPRLSHQIFQELYSNFDFLPNEIWKKYLKTVNLNAPAIPANVHSWFQLFDAIIQRHKYAREQIDIITFCFTLKNHKSYRGCQFNFLLHLLQLHIPSLMAMEMDEFGIPAKEDQEAVKESQRMIESFVSSKHMREMILQHMGYIMKIEYLEGKFQQLILHEILKVTEPKVQELQKMSTVIIKALGGWFELLITDQQWITSAPSANQTIALQLLLHCCKQIPLKSRDVVCPPAALAKYTECIQLLGNVYRVCAKEDDKKYAMLGEVKSQLVSEYFGWVSNMHKLLESWKSSHTLSFETLHQYYKHHENIEIIAGSLANVEVVIAKEEVEKKIENYICAIERLNIALIAYSDDDPSLWWPTVSLLSEWGVSLHQNVANNISENLLYPDETGIEGDPIPHLTKRQFNPPSEHIHLRLKKTLSLVQIQEIADEIESCFEPIKEIMPLLVYFKIHPNQVFSTHMKHAIRSALSSDIAEGCRLSEVTLVHLRTAVETVKNVLINTFCGKATYKAITANGALNLKEIDVQGELQVLAKSPILGERSDSVDGISRISNILSVIKYLELAKVIWEVCLLYDLKICTKDDDLIWLNERAKEHTDDEDKRDQLTPNDATSLLGSVKLRLHSDNPHLSTVFKAAHESEEFYHFLKENKFTKDEGYGLFKQQFALVRDQLQSEDYNDTVLNHLFVAFEFISPFLKPKQTFNELMISVSKLQPENGQVQLDTVRKNIHVIQLWFSRAGGDTIENVSNELKNIMTNGTYCLRFGMLQKEEQLVLKYFPTMPAQKSPQLLRQQSAENPVLNEPKLEPNIVAECWGKSKINNFVQKLGFLDSSQSDENGKLINAFRQLTNSAYSLHEIITTLRVLGHPKFSLDLEYYLKCCKYDYNNSATAEVNDHNKCLDEWKKRLDVLYEQHCRLLFYRVPKIMTLYYHLEKRDITGVWRETNFLFQQDKESQKELRDVIENALPSDKPQVSSPIEYVGAFLDEIFSHASNATLQLAQRYSYTTPSVASREGFSTLHIGLEFSQTQLVLLILQMYNGLPEAFEVLHCTPHTTEQDIQLFMRRIKITEYSRRYLVLEVDVLPFHLQEFLSRIYLDLKQQHTAKLFSTLHFVETGPSIFDEMVPPLKCVEYKKEEGPKLNPKEAMVLFKKYNTIETLIVYGAPGIGKTHYIREKMQKKFTAGSQVTIPVNEAFSTRYAIDSLCSLPYDGTKCAIFFNFTMLQHMGATHERELKQYNRLMTEIGWFFFKLLVLGYIEDYATGKSFQLPQSASWEIYVEVPSSDANTEPADTLKLFLKQIPTLQFVGTTRCIDNKCNMKIDDDTQLVCKYLKALKSGDIDNIYEERGSLIKFSVVQDLPQSECEMLLNYYMPEHVKLNKVTQRTFIRYMARRCRFLDCLPSFNFNQGGGEISPITKKTTDTRHLGSVLMKTMLKEVSEFCDPTSREGWTQKAHQQLIYDFKDKGGSIGLVTLIPDEIPQKDMQEFVTLGVHIPSEMEMMSRSCLDQYLSRSLNVPLEKNKMGHMCLLPIDEANYVLTLDFALKMLNIHERRECRVPAILEGETGVGKTALVKMLSELWNYSWQCEWNLRMSRIVDLLENKIKSQTTIAEDTTLQGVIKLLREHKCPPEDDLETLSQLPHKNQLFFQLINKDSSITALCEDPMLTMVDLKLGKNETISTLFTHASSDAKATAHLLHVIFSAKVKKMFYKLNVHDALTTNDIEDFFEPVLREAEILQAAYEKLPKKLKLNSQMPFVTAYLDEINTCSCLGLFKEIIVDRTLLGKSVPQNIFVIASCNPHRGDVLTLLDKRELKKGLKESWLKGSYYVRQMHPTLKFLMWDYGSLNKHDEEAYINAKMSMISQTSVIKKDSSEIVALSDLIVQSQCKMRDYAAKELRSMGIDKITALLCAKSCVSQRDIQRAFILYQWFMNVYSNMELEQKERRAVLVSLGIVYFIRLTSSYRLDYRNYLDYYENLPGDITFSMAYKDELNRWMEYLKLPPGISKAVPLKENVLAIIACASNHIPLVMVGAPGSSKTLSFNIVIANMKGKESKSDQFRRPDIFHSLEPHFYQCSRRTSSNEIEKIFERAISRQNSLARSQLPVYCVVFMDEAGLPEDKYESLKALHHHLDKQEVSFVAISNHVLDAAKTNRAISLIRPSSTESDLHELAKECIMKPGTIQPVEDDQCVVNLCKAYLRVVEDSKFSQLYGLRDFIYFIIYLRRKRIQRVTSQLIIEGLERCFNGTVWFQEICDLFLEQQRVSTRAKKSIVYRSMLSILKASIEDMEMSSSDDVHSSIQSEVRFKLIIDPSADESLVRLLFTFGVLNRQTTKMYICSEFPPDSQSRVNIIAQIRHSVAVGHTVLLSQTDEIHESFYDLFNQRFRSIEIPGEKGKPKECRYYANIAIGAHSKPCRVNPKFQCVVVVNDEEIKNTPAPFLNRFEKYQLSHKSILDSTLDELPRCLEIVLRAVFSKVTEFVKVVVREWPIPKNQRSYTLYGLTEATLDSLFLSILPSEKSEYIPLKEDQFTETLDLKLHILLTLIQALKMNAKFNIEAISSEELEEDCKEIFLMILGDSKEETAKNHDYLEELEKIEAEQKEQIENIEYVVAVRNAIDEALYILYHAPGPQEDAPIPIYSDVFISSCMIISVLVQWLVRYFCKHLMQLMTPETLVYHNEEIPRSFQKHYLKFQQHFSIEELVQMQMSKLEKNDWNSSVYATKLLCFTRSSSLIQKIPSEYPPPVPTSEDYAWMEKFVYHELNQIAILKVSLAHSQNYLENYFASFMKNPSAKLMLLVVRMPDISRKMVNHLRIMIEEAENEGGYLNKVFVVLLHFPSTSFFDPCYPSLFLQGWDHYYLDSVGHGTLNSSGDVTEVLAVKQWFQTCCFPRDFSTNTKDQMVITLQKMVEEAIPYVASRLVIQKCGHFNCAMNAAKRREVVRCILIDKKFGDEFASGYCSYWSPEKMMELIRKSTRFTHTKKSTLNLTDSMQSSFYSHFSDYMVYMLNKFNQDCSLDVVCEQHTDLEREAIMLNLCLSLAAVLPRPELSQLPALCNQFVNKSIVIMSRVPKFPMFLEMCKMIDSTISTCKKTKHMKVSSLRQSYKEETDFKADPGIADMNQAVMEYLNERALSKGNSDILSVAMMKMKNDRTGSIWRRYCSDFVHHKLHIREGNELSVELLEAYIRTVDTSNVSSTSRMIALHVHIEEHQLNLSQLSHIIRPVSKFRGDELETTMTLTKSDSTLAPISIIASVATPQSSSKDTTQLLPDVYTLIVNLLFDFISSRAKAIEQHTLDFSEVTNWHRCYQEIILMPGLMEGIIKNLKKDTEKKINIMHMTYLAIGCSSERKPSIGLEVFNELCSQYFEGSVIKSCPRLENCMDYARRLMSSAKINFFERLLAYFFSEHRTHFNEEDCKWFLSFSNQPDCPFSTMMIWFYLTKVLGIGKDESIGLFIPKRRKLVALSLLTTTTTMGQPGPYLPTYYCQTGYHVAKPPSVMPMMQQPLAHLYFSTVLERLQKQPSTPNHLIRMAKKMLKENLSKEELVLQAIEKQALLQILFQQTAAHIQTSRKAQVLFTTQVIDEINRNLNDKSFGGSQTKPSCHGLVLAMHLKQQMMSRERLVRILQDNGSTLVKNIPVAKLMQSLIETKPALDHHLLPFIGRDNMSELGQLYKNVCRVTEKIYNDKKRDQRPIEELVGLAKIWCSEEKVIRVSKSKSCMKGTSAFQMITWLCFYNVFYKKKQRNTQQSEHLATVIQNHLRDFLDTNVVYLLQSFLHPSNMIKRLEPPMVLDENAERLQFSLRGTHLVPIPQEGELRDPLFELFHPTDVTKQDPNDQELCDALANMVAAVLAYPPQHIHLWYHMFAADELLNTFMTGFLYDGKVQEGRLYDCGVELAMDGSYGRPDYIPRANCGSFNLHSFYLMLFCNFGAFCIGMLTQPEGQQRVGKIIAQNNSTRHYCVSQLRAVWLHMLQNMQLTSEERVYLITRSMYSVIELSASKAAILKEGRFQSSKDMQEYEKLWHDKVFLPNSSNIHAQYKNYCSNWETTLLKDIRCLEAKYPHFPTVGEFRQNVLSSVNFGTSPEHPLCILSQLMLQLPRLEVAGILLPDLIKFYYWVHTEGAHRVEWDYAQNNGLEEFITKGDERFPEMSLKTLFENMRAAYNDYVVVVGRSIGAGACANIKRGNELYTITDDTPMISLLSVGESLEEGYDWLYLVMLDIINFHNSLLDIFMQALSLSQMKHLLSVELSDTSLLPLEVDGNACIIPQSRNNRNNQLLHLIRSRCVISEDGTATYDFENLQRDIVFTFILGKAKISTDNLRKQFQFRQRKHDSFIMDLSVLDLSTIDHHVDKDFKVDMDITQKKDLECEFHSLDYNKMMDVVTGLRIAVEHLIKLTVSDPSTKCVYSSKTLEYLTHRDHSPTPSAIKQKDVSTFFGFNGLSQPQQQWLISRMLVHLYKILEFFVAWVNDGLYDFHHLPYLMKRSLSDHQQAAIQRIPDDPQFKADPDALVKEIQVFEEILLHNEENLRKEISAKEVPLIEYLHQLKFILKSDQLPHMIPEDILCQNYVATRIALRRILVTAQKEKKNISPKKWSDYVADLWNEKNLKHLRDIAVPNEKQPQVFEYDPITGLYAYEEDFEERHDEEEGFLFIDEDNMSEREPVDFHEQLPPPSPLAARKEIPSITSIVPEKQNAIEVPDVSQAVKEQSPEEKAKSMDVTKYLEYLKLDTYIKLFVSEGVDGSLLWEMCHAEEDELKDLGIENGFHRRKIKKKLDEYLQAL